MATTNWNATRLALSSTPAEIFDSTSKCSTRRPLYTHVYMCIYLAKHIFAGLFDCLLVSLTTHYLGSSKRWNAFVFEPGYLRPQLNQLECQFQVNSSTNNPSEPSNPIKSHPISSSRPPLTKQNSVTSQVGIVWPSRNNFLFAILGD